MAVWCPQYQICLWLPRCDKSFIISRWWISNIIVMTMMSMMTMLDDQICLWLPRCDITFIVVHDCANLRTRICSEIVTIGISIGSSIIIIVFAVFIIISRSIIGSDFSAKVNGEIVHSMKWILKGRVSQTNYSFIGPVVHNGGKSSKWLVQNCKIGSLLGLEIRHSGFEGGWSLAFWLRGWMESGILASGLISRPKAIFAFLDHF